MTQSSSNEQNGLPQADWIESLRSRCLGSEETQIAIAKWHDLLRSKNKYSEPSIPKTIGRFEIVRLISFGGMGVVYEARDPFPPRPVAIKVMRAHLTSPHLAKRFRSEAYFLARLEHPGIARIYEANWDYQQPYIVLEYIEGERLLDYALLNDLDLAQRLALLVQICKAVHYAHQQGIIHRDLKPANIVIDQSGVAKVLDFGLSLTIDPADAISSVHTRLDQAIGTLPYMSPEQVSTESQRRIDARSDLYAIAILGYELLVGRRPYSLEGKSITESLRIICEQSPTTLSQFEPSLRGDLECIFGKALEKDPKDRYPSVDCFSKDIERFLAGQPVQAKPVGLFGRLRRWVRREPHLALMIGTLLLVLLTSTLGAVIALSTLRQSHDESLAANKKLNDSLDRERTIAQNEARMRKYADELLSKSRRQLYATEMTDAYLAFNRPDYVVLGDLLEKQVPPKQQEDLRGWEWNHLYRTINSATEVIRWHQSPVRTVAFSPDGRWLASGSYDGQVSLVRTSDWLPIWTDTRWIAPIHHVSFSPDGQVLAIGDASGDIRLLNMQTLALERVLQGNQQPARAIGFLQNHGLIIAATGGISEVNPTSFSPGYIRTWDRNNPGDSPNEILNHPSQFSSLDVSSKGAVAASTWNGRVRWFQDIFNQEPTWLPEELDQSTHVDFSPQGDQLAQVGWHSGVRIWDVVEKRLLQTLDLPTCSCVRFSADGKELFLAARHEAIVYRWDLSSNSLRDMFFGHTRPILDISVSPDGLFVATASIDGTIRIWETGKKHSDQRFRGHTDEIDAIAVSPRGDFFVSGSRDHTAKLWDTATGKVRFEWNPDAQPVRAVAVSNDGNQIALGGKSVRIIDAARGTELRKIQIDRGYVRTLKFAPDDSKLLAGTHIDATNPSESSGNLMVISTGDWVDHKKWHDVSGEGIWAMDYSEDGHWFASGGTSGKITLRNAASGAIIERWSHGAGWISSLAFSSDNKHLAVGCWDVSGTKTKSVPIRIWDLETMKLAQELAGHSLAVFALDYSSDGKRLISGGSAGDLLFWDTSDYMLRARIDLPNTGWVHSARFTPDALGLLSITGRQRNACDILMMQNK